MSGLEAAEGMVSQLAPRDLALFRKWFAEFDGAAWDEQIDADAAAGRLDNLAEEALADYRVTMDEPPGLSLSASSSLTDLPARAV